MRITVTSGDARKHPTKNLFFQRAYYHKSSEPYPDKIEMMHTDNAEILTPGEYEFTEECFGNDRDGRFGLAFGWPSKLKRVSDVKKAAAA